MKIRPLCEYIAALLQTCIVQMSHTLDILQLYNTENTDLADFYKDRLLLQYMEENTPDRGPKFSFINTNDCFIHFRDAATKSIYGIGPIHLLSTTENQNALYTQEIPSLDIYREQMIPSLSMYNVTKYTLLLYNTLHEDSCTPLDCIKENFKSDNAVQNAALTTMNALFQNRENDSFHTTFSQEMRLLSVIEAGDIEGLKRNWKEPGNEEIVTVDMRNPTRTGKNYAIYNVIACGRAAIRGGLQTEYIFSLTESYIQQIEDLKDMLLLQSIVEEFQYHVTSMVAEKKSRISPDCEPADALLSQCETMKKSL